MLQDQCSASKAVDGKDFAFKVFEKMRETQQKIMKNLCCSFGVKVETKYLIIKSGYSGELIVKLIASH